MKRLTLRTRLLLAAALWIAVAWPLGTAALYHAFLEAVTERFDAKLRAVLETLVEKVVVDPSTGTPSVAAPINPTFGDPSANWFWIVAHDGERTASLAPEFVLALPISTPGGLDETLVEPIETERGPFRAATIRRATDPSTETVTATVLIGSADIDAELRTFASLLTLAIGLLGLGLIVPIVLQVQYGLAPLRRLTGDLAEIRNGSLDRVPDSYPPDIDPIRRSINEVLDHDRLVVERARKGAGNLAHALKTELAILDASRHGAGGRRQTDEATKRISRIVDHHLARASSAAAGRPGISTDVEKVAREIAEALTRVHAPRGIAVQLDMHDLPAVRVERQDLDEIIGNLVENACEHATSTVRVSGRARDGDIVLVVSDDGRGMEKAEREMAVRRGVRLDELGDGTGLGLSIVTDLVTLYGGRFELDEASLGGLEAVVSLPVHGEIGSTTTATKASR